MHLEKIRIYPVKALRGGLHDTADTQPWGLQGDRCWMVVDSAGRLVSQREHGRMALIEARNTATGVALATRSGATIEVAPPGDDAETIMASLWDDLVPARVAAPAASAWVSDAVGLPSRLVYLADKTARQIDPKFARPGQPVNFADGFPVLLVSLASLADLNARLAVPIPIGRFRPNLVVADAPSPWDEDQWRVVRIGDATFDVVKPCDRCIVTTIDPETGERPDPPEPLRTLGTFRRDVRGRVMFGQNLIPRTLGRIGAGDPVEVLERGPGNMQLHSRAAA